MSYFATLLTATRNAARKKGEAGLSRRSYSCPSPRFVLSRFALLSLSSAIPKVAHDTTTTAIDPRFTDRKRQPGLDLLRALAILIVTIYHAGIMGFPLPGRVHRFGWIGVDLFFVLSGYLIGGQLLARSAGEGTPSSRDRAGLSLGLGRFFARRTLRILPAYFVILAIYVFLPSWREYPDMFPLWKFLVSVQNIGLRGGTAFSHAWSLAVEDQFYLLLPLILLLVVRRPRAALFIPCLIVVGGFGLRWLMAMQNLGEDGVDFRGYQTWIYYATWTRLDPLVLGVVLAAIEKFRTQWWQRLADIAPWLGLPALALIVYALWLGETDSITVAMSVWQFPLIALGMAALLLCAVSPRLPFRRIKMPGAAFIASVAYSAYLVQKLVIHFAAQFCAGHDIIPTSGFAVVAVQVLIFAAATILFFAVERPFLRLRHRIAGRDAVERTQFLNPSP